MFNYRFHSRFLPLLACLLDFLHVQPSIFFILPSMYGESSRSQCVNSIPCVSWYISLKLSLCSILSRQRTDSWCSMAAARYTNLNQFTAPVQPSWQLLSPRTCRELWGKQYLLSYRSAEPRATERKCLTYLDAIR